MGRSGFSGRALLWLLACLAVLASIPSGARAQSERPEDRAEDLILEVRLENYVLFEALGALTLDNKIYLPVAGLADALEFYAEETPERGLVEGWVIDPARRYTVDLEDGLVRAGDRTVEFAPDDGFVAFNQVYLDSAVLEEIWPVGFVYEPNRLLLWVNPREQLPVQARLERQERRESLLGERFTREDYPREDVPYELFTPPIGDFQASVGYDTDEGAIGSYSALLANDLLHATGELFVVGDANDGLSDARLSLSRVDPDGELLGVPGLSRARVGDISTPGISLVAPPRLERGAILSSSVRPQAISFDSTDIEGDSLPGYEAELYRNGTLIDFQVVPENGRYSFEAVPLQLGRNEFEVVQYGPQGQRRVETVLFFVGPEMIRTGDLQWTAALSQANEGLFFDAETRGGGDQTAGPDAPRGLAGSLEATYGLTDGISAYASAARVPRNDRPLDGTDAESDARMGTYGKLGLRSSVLGVYLRANTLASADGGLGAETTAQTRFEGINATAAHVELSDFESDVVGYGDNALVRRSELRLDSYLPYEWLSFLPANRFVEATARREVEAGGRTDTSLGQGVSFRAYDVFFNHDLRYRLEQDELRGTLGTSGYVRRVFLRGQMAYEALPRAGLDSLSLSADYDIDPETRLRGAVRQNFDESQETRLSASINRDFGHFRLGFGGDVTSEGEAFVGLNLAVSLGPNPYGGVVVRSDSLARRGATAMRVFEDTDLDGEYDPETDRPIERARPEIEFTPLGEPRTGPDGTLIRSGFAPYEPVNLAVAPGSLENPFWRPSVPGVRIVPRPGRIVPVRVPVVETGEIEGTVRVVRDGEAQPLARASVEVIDENGQVVGKTTSSYDGYFYVRDLLPGTYSLRVEAGYLLNGQPYTLDAPEVTIDRDSLVKAGVRLDVRPREGGGDAS